MYCSSWASPLFGVGASTFQSPRSPDLCFGHFSFSQFSYNITPLQFLSSYLSVFVCWHCPVFLCLFSGAKKRRSWRNWLRGWRRTRITWRTLSRKGRNFSWSNRRKLTCCSTKSSQGELDIFYHTQCIMIILYLHIQLIDIVHIMVFFSTVIVQ